MQNIPYGRQLIEEDDIQAVEKVLRSDYLTQGPRISEFEQTVAEYHGAKYGVAFSSGTAALHAAYSSLGIKEGDEIISSPITFAASTNGAIYCGAKPCFVDMDPQTNCLDINKLESVITQKTKVITPVAYSGYPVDLKAIHEIASAKGIKVLYDSAHALGSKRNGTFGMEYIDAAILSFHPVKHIATGEGGMVLTSDDQIWRNLIRFRNHGITKEPTELNNSDGPWYYEMQSLGFNYRITDIQCALGTSQFKRIFDNLKRRNEIAKVYQEQLEPLSCLETPPCVGFEILENDDSENISTIHSYHLYTVRTSDSGTRLKLYNYLREHNVLTQVHYVPVHLHPYYRDRYGYKAGDYPNAEEFYGRELSIPMFHSLHDEQVEYIIDQLKIFDRTK